ncbi:CMP-N-acetylneuraminate-beta-galactosamide-alpha-2,3-sialyltransferase 4 [Ornithorhynchus anatinus]|uniref:ST3 beta-galactoside alpha-2,3-sialyltransferase 4 n=1 Tax=Ornithorhynchus anatinus TaxID=9258 RepID=F7A0Z1_ORNAN|nr:CMP-N-acetylneuraminate-beta-galactosamide-alpha-2,3-sialyltransferase 4 [Ornithorhynchus anatinus]XP_028919262.1 CMP-N-acetylneuraminate-beta-galactosamide-alpha-2,3-sialyltransferase 4 [Ornithorhynchus anatinus]XP_028919264.1 CMP-N-acetylneuraminate-beta-galactosamide-alpha-2,3-sialyltransferase 4 [Ornithorhynchus anatinus]
MDKELPSSLQFQTKISFTRKIWRIGLYLLIMGLCFEVFHYITTAHMYFRKDICKKPLAWKEPLGRLDPSWTPFLTTEELHLTRHSQSKELFQNNLPFGLNNTVFLAAEVLLLLPQQGLPKSIKRLPCRKCIVVGNSFSLRGRGLGQKIDSFDIIIRLNDAPVKGFQEDVGEKTTIRLFFPESALPNPLDNNEEDTLMVLVPFKAEDFIWVKEILRKTPSKTSKGFWKPPPQVWNGKASHLRVLNPFVTYETTYIILKLRKSSQKWSTTGFIALNLALHICHEVSIVGFGYPDINDNVTPVHYYKNDYVSSLRLMPHDIPTEQMWLLNW